MFARSADGDGHVSRSRRSTEDVLGVREDSFEASTKMLHNCCFLMLTSMIQSYMARYDKEGRVKVGNESLLLQVCTYTMVSIHTVYFSN